MRSARVWLSIHTLRRRISVSHRHMLLGVSKELKLRCPQDGIASGSRTQNQRTIEPLCRFFIAPSCNRDQYMIREMAVRSRVAALTLGTLALTESATLGKRVRRLRVGSFAAGIGNYGYRLKSGEHGLGGYETWQAQACAKAGERKMTSIFLDLLTRFTRAQAGETEKLTC